MNRIEAVRAEESRIRAAMESIEQGAVDLGRDLTDEEETNLGVLRASYEGVSTRIVEVAGDLAQRAETARLLAEWEASNPPANGHSLVTIRSERPTMTPGQYVATYLRAQGLHLPNAQPVSATEREEAATLLRTVAETGTGDTAGILPTPIVGDLVKFVDANRPVIQSMRPMPMPAQGKTFTRPRLTQSTQVGTQTEKSQLSSRQFTTTGDTVTKATHGGVLNLTEQDIDWSDPALLQIAVEDLAEQYAIDTETTAATAVAAGATTTVTGLDVSAADAIDWANALAAGAGSVYGTAKVLPDTLYASVAAWQFIAGLTDSTGRPLYPALAPMNTSGTMDLTSFAGNPMGLRLVVSPHFTGNFLAVAASTKLEQYEQDKGLLQIPVPSQLEVQVAYRGYFATNVYAQGLCALVP